MPLLEFIPIPTGLTLLMALSLDLRTEEQCDLRSMLLSNVLESSRFASFCTLAFYFGFFMKLNVMQATLASQ